MDKITVKFLEFIASSFLFLFYFYFLVDSGNNNALVYFSVLNHMPTTVAARSVAVYALGEKSM
jgi:hypothetical protein